MSELDSAVADRIAAHRPEQAPPFSELLARRRRQRRVRAGAGIAGVAAVGTAAVLLVPAALRGDPSPAVAASPTVAPTAVLPAAGSPAPGFPARTSTPGPGQAAGPADQAAWARWQARGAADYTIRLTRKCFCPPYENALVRVRAGRAVGPPDPEPGGEPRSIADLFDMIFSGSNDRFTVTYDPTYGFPTRLDIDVETNAIDDEHTWTVNQYRPAG